MANGAAALRGRLLPTDRTLTDDQIHGEAERMIADWKNA